ncbi:hypothetical protein DXN04_15915 [Chitinophaga silvisoli]|uniref:Uncharacterized protein n=2 Tax=Chitinophaga silvisoli TaxID=2291814 RepID=A0A3E1NZS4_9BACT|nr:hypothetical protein DXN04_15915 [Chitinophaga silvisoli]
MWKRFYLAQLCGWYDKTKFMTEKIQVNNQDVYLFIATQEGEPDVIPTEYFTVSYSLEEHEPGKVFNDENGAAKRFTSPVEAVEYAVEKLPVILG